MPLTEMSPPTQIKITVGIPTYNRSEALIRRLRELENLSKGIAGVIICDNSDIFNHEANEICNRNENWRYLKNPENLGFGLNFLRLLELVETTHLWWRGDDDVISQSQATAVTTAGLARDELLILDPDKNHTFAGEGLENFCRNFEKIQSMGWISALIVPTQIAKRAIAAGHAGIPSGYPHFSLVLNMLEENPNLKFRVVPFDLKQHEFRDMGEKEGQRWAFFGLCIRGFSETANAIKDKRIRSIYLRAWRNTQSFRNVRKMVSLRLGLIGSEPITFSTLSPLLSIRNPKTIPLFAVLYTVAKCPSCIPRIAIMLWSFRKSPEELESVNLGFMSAHRSFFKRYRLLKELGEHQKPAS